MDGLLGLLGLAAYFLPTLVALVRKKVHPGAVIVVNLFLGWTVTGWIIALAMGASGATTTDAPTSTSPTSPVAQAANTSRRNGALIILGLLVAIFYLLPKATTPATTFSAAATSRAAVANVPVATSAAVSTPHIGTVVRDGNWQYQVISADTAKTLRWGASSASVVTPKGIWVVVTLDLTNVGTRNFTLNAWDLELWDANGIKYDPASFESLLYSDSVNNGSHVGDQMPPGVKVRVTLLFDVAPGALGLKLHPVQGGPDIGLQ
jgi:hypothetical protein